MMMTRAVVFAAAVAAAKGEGDKSKYIVPTYTLCRIVHNSEQYLVHTARWHSEALNLFLMPACKRTSLSARTMKEMRTFFLLFE